MTKHHYRGCHLCEAMCGVDIEVDVPEERIVSIRGDERDEFSRGHICPKAMGLKDVHEDPDRLKRPQRRSGDRWEEIGWDEAFEIVATKLHETQTKYGKSSVAVYQGNPTVHNYGSVLFGQFFVRALGSRSMFSATSVDQLPQMLSALLMFGHQLLLAIPDLDRTQFLLILGANPIASNGSLMTAPDVGKRLKAIRARGGRVVVVDPRRTETAEIADEHVFIRPGTDAMFLLGMLHTIFTEKRASLGKLASFTDGVEVLEALVQPYSAERVAPAVGMESETIKRLAREFAGAKSAAGYGRVGICTQEFGGLAAWLLTALNVVTGNLDREGGVMFTAPAVDIVELGAKLGQKGHFDKGRSRVRGLPEFGGELPVATLAEEIETPGKGQIRALVTSCGNPVLSTPNGQRLDRAMAKLDFYVAIDVYRNETTRHANIILPPTWALEHDNYDLAFHALAIRNTAKYSPALFDAGKGARHDYEIFLALASGLAAKRGGLGAIRAKAMELALTRLKPEGALDLLLRTGPHGGLTGLSLQKLKDAPHGIDLGPMTPCLPGRLYTNDKRISLSPPRLVADLPRLDAMLRARAWEGDHLTLIGRRDLRSNNSWMHNSQRLVKGRPRCTLYMHPLDAAARGLSEGAVVTIASRVGSVETNVEVTDEVMKGVVSLPHGWGHGRKGIKQRVAEAHPGVSANDLTDEESVDALSGNAVLSGVRVTVSASDAPSLVAATSMQCRQQII